jgi:hypothetical protein
MIKNEQLIRIEKVEHVGNYRLKLVFNDDTIQLIDFFNFLSSSLNPLIRKYLNIQEFIRFSINNGDLEWNDYDLCFPIVDLYENNIMPKNKKNIIIPTKEKTIC